MKSILTIVVVFSIAIGVFYATCTIFVVPPIGAVPEGRTLIISRMNKTEFIDSADAMCERTQGGINLLCRLAMFAAISKNADVYLRLPYIEPLYLISTGGTTYSR